MVTVYEQRYFETITHCLPHIMDSLASIAKSLDEINKKIEGKEQRENSNK